MLKTIRTFILLSVALDIIAFAVFLVTDQRGLFGYASVLIYCSLGIGVLGGLSLMGSGSPRHVNEEFMRAVTSDEDTRRIHQSNREQGLSFGLVLFLVAILSGVSGYVLNYSHP